MSLPSLFRPQPFSVAFTQARERSIQPAELVDMVRGLLSSFDEVMRVVALDLRLCCVGDEHPIREPNVRPEHPKWHLRQEPPPTGVLVEPEPGAVVVGAADIGGAAVDALLERALGQEMPVAGRLWAIRDLVVTASLARICDPEARRRGVLLVNDQGEIHEFALHVDPSGAWLGGPGPALEAPPMSLRLTQESASLRLHVMFSLSPWCTPGEPEHEILARCLRRLLPAWSLDEPDRHAELFCEDPPPKSLAVGEHILIQGVTAAPADRGPRLVYADWLEERGDPRAEYLRLLTAVGEGEAGPLDPLHRLCEIRPTLDQEWVRQMHQGITRGGLGYTSVDGLHGELRLNAGPQVRLRVLHQRMTYASLMAGAPNKKTNDNRIARAVEEARNGAAGGRVYLVAPPRRDYHVRPGDMRWLARDDHVPEWLPAVTCIGWFGDALSELAVVWFQGELAPPIHASVLKEIRQLDWGTLAAQWGAEDL